MAQKAEQRRHFKAVLCAKPKTYAQIKHERKEKEKEERRKKNPPSTLDDFRADNSTSGMLDGFFLVRCRLSLIVKKLNTTRAITVIN